MLKKDKCIDKVDNNYLITHIHIGVTDFGGQVYDGELAKIIEKYLR